MSELDIAISGKAEPVSKKAGFRDAKPTSSVKARTGDRLRFETFLIVAACIVAVLGAYESLTEMYLPGLSLLKQAHLYGYLKQYPIIYEPSKGIWHQIGWTGSFMMVVMMLYSVRKRVSFLSSIGHMRHWLSAHMFLGIIGPLLVTFHTTFKFHGLIATSFWCMITTMVFGILGRYIYIQIPRNITGAELGVKEIDGMVERLNAELGKHLSEAKVASLMKEITTADDAAEKFGALRALLFMMKTDIVNRFKIRSLRRTLKAQYTLKPAVREEVLGHFKRKAALIRKKNFLTTSHRLLHYWHVLHVPLAIVMFIIMFLHVIVYYVFRAAY